jgi:O-antigen ligase
MRESCDAMNERLYHDRLLLGQDDLIRGIWPRSASFWMLAIWIALLIIRPWEKLMPEMAEWHPERIYAIFAIMMIAAAGAFQFRNSYQTTGLLLWFAALGISSMGAYDFSAAWDELYVYITLFIFYFAILAIVKTPYQLVFIILCYIAVLAAYLGKSQWEYFLYNGYEFAMGVRRLQGIDLTCAHPNSVACSTVISLPFAAFLWKVRKPLTAGWPDFWRKCFPYALIGYYYIAISSILLTNSRSGIFAFVLFLMLSSLSSGGLRKIVVRLAFAAVLVGIIWSLAPEDTKGRLANTWDPSSGPDAESAYASGEGRIQGLKVGWEIFQRFPLSGVGLGNFIPYRRVYLDGAPMVAHNTIGGVLGETGIIGGLAFLVFLSGVFVNHRRMAQLAKSTCNGTVHLLFQLTLACQYSTILVLFTGMFGDNQRRAQLYWVAAFCLLARIFADAAIVEESAAPVKR